MHLLCSISIALDSGPAKGITVSRPPVVAVMGHVDHGKVRSLSLFIFPQIVIDYSPGRIEEHKCGSRRGRRNNTGQSYSRGLHSIICCSTLEHLKFNLNLAERL